MTAYASAGAGGAIHADDGPFCVIVTHDADGEEVKRLGPMRLRNAERVLDGLLMQINHDEYSAGIVEA